MSQFDNNPSDTPLERPAPWESGLLRVGFWICAIAGCAGAAWWAVHVGKGVGWDQMNYHHYNVYAWLSGRMDADLAPAGMHTWINPLLYVPSYWMVNYLPPKITGAIFGGVAGLNLALLYALACLSLRNVSPLIAATIALTSAIAGLSDPFFHSNLGSSDADVFLSLHVIGSLCLICWAASDELFGQWPEHWDKYRRESRRRWLYAAAAALLGAAAGLKLTYFVYAIGMTVAVLVLWRGLRMNRRRFACFAAGGIGGYALTGGYWNWLMWSRYRNPFMPYFNDIFHSPWMMDFSFRDTRFPTQSFSAMLRFPFQWFAGEHPTSEGPFRIAIFAILFVIIPLVVVVAVMVTANAVLVRFLSNWRHGDATINAHAGARKNQMTSPTLMWLVVIFWIVSYALWAWMFAIQRYLEPLALLAGWMLWLLCDYLLTNRRMKWAVFSCLVAFSVLWMRGEDQGWRVPYGESWFGVKLPAAMQREHTLFVAIGGGPMSYLTAYLPASTTTVRFNDLTIPPNGPETDLTRRAARMIANHTGPLRSLSSIPPGMPLSDQDRAYLERFGLAQVETACTQFATDVTQFTTCPLLRRNPAP